MKYTTWFSRFPEHLVTPPPKLVDVVFVCSGQDMFGWIVFQWKPEMPGGSNATKRIQICS